MLQNPVQIPRIDVNLAFDAIFTEMPSRGLGDIFLVSAMALLKPATMWTTSPPSDSNFASLLLHGVFPMAPAPSGDHSLGLQGLGQFLKFGPMLRALHGRQWNLTPHAVSCEAAAQTQHCSANVFDVPDGQLIAVIALSSNGPAVEDEFESITHDEPSLHTHPPPPPPPASGTVRVRLAPALLESKGKVESLQVGRTARWVSIHTTAALHVEAGIAMLRFTPTRL